VRLARLFLFALLRDRILVWHEGEQAADQRQRSGEPEQATP